MPSRTCNGSTIDPQHNIPRMPSMNRVPSEFLQFLQGPSINRYLTLKRSSTDIQLEAKALSLAEDPQEDIKEFFSKKNRTNRSFWLENSQKRFYKRNYSQDKKEHISGTSNIKRTLMKSFSYSSGSLFCIKQP